MTPFIIFFIVLTLGYILYYAAIITIDLNAKPKDGNKEVEEVDTEGMVPEGTGEPGADEDVNDDEDDEDNDNSDDEEESAVTYDEENEGFESDDDEPQETEDSDDNIYGIKDDDDDENDDVDDETQPHEFAVEVMSEEEVLEEASDEITEEDVPELTEEQKKEILPPEPDASPEAIEMASVLNNSGETVMAESPDAVPAEDLLSEGFMDSVREAADSDYALTPQIDKT